MLPSDNSFMAPPRSKPITAPSLTATLEVPFSDCTIAASVAPRPETFQATSALPASQSICAESRKSGRAAMPVSETSAANAGSADDASSVTRPWPLPL